MNRMFSNRHLINLIMPLLVEQLLAMLVGMFDTMMVSSVGEAAISGVSIVNDVNSLAIMLLSAIAGGGAVCVSQYLGNKDEHNTRVSASQLIMISFLISFGFGLFCLIFHRQILMLLYGSVAMDVMAAARTYFWITALSFPFLGVYNSSAAIFRSMNKTRETMNVSILVNIINLVGNYLGIFIFKLGVVGVALPTLISRAVGCIVMFAMTFNQENVIRVSFRRIFSWRKEIIHKILSIAVPNGIENGLFQLGKVLISTFVATYGTSQIAANGVTNSISVLCYATESAIQLAMVTVVGQCVGANDYEQAQYYIKKMILWAYGMAIVNNILVLALSPFALKLYTLTPETAKIATTILLMECVAVALLHPIAFPLPTCLRAAGDARFTMIVGVSSMFIARVGLAYILGTLLHMGVVGTRIGWYVDWTVRIIFFATRYKSGKWKEYRIV